MKESKQKSHCSATVKPAPTYVTCLRCGYEVELWSDEEETVCPVCGRKVFKKEATVH